MKDNDTSTPTFLVEITCPSSPYPGQSSVHAVPRIARAGEVLGATPFLMVNEIDIIARSDGYVVRHGGGKFYVGFRDFISADPGAFHRHALNEIARANRVIAALLPASCAIVAMDVVYATNPEMTDLRPHWKAPDLLAESPPIAVTDEGSVAAGWERMIEEAIGGGKDSITALIGLEGRHPTVAFCISALSESGFPSYYRAFEALRHELGGEDRLVELGILGRKQIKRFRDNAQARRHANHRISTKPMHEHEAKLIVLRMLKSYMRHSLFVPPESE